MLYVISKSLCFRNLSIAKTARSIGTKNIEQSIYEVSRKCIINTETDGIVVKSPYKNAELPETTIDRYTWTNLSKWPNHTAIECSATGKKYTYVKLRDHCAALAIRLRRDLKLEKNDIVAICLPNIPEYPLTFLGSIEAGLIVTTANPAYKPEELSKQFQDCRPKLIFCTVDNYDIIRKSCILANQHDTQIVTIKTLQHQNTPSDTINFDELIDKTGLNLIDAAAFNNNADLDQTAVILYSSGTTGLPKGVMHSHRTTIGLSQILVPNRFYEPHILPTTNDFQDVTVSFLPFFHVYGLAVTLLNQLLLGSKVLSMKYEINHFLDSIVKHKATILPLVPPVVIQLNNHSHTSSTHFQYARNIMCGAASLADSDVERLLKFATQNINFIQGYGLTEGFISFSPNELKCYGSVGFTLPCNEVKIVNVDDTTFTGIGPNRPGEVLARSPSNMKGYYRNENATKATFTEDGWLRTGDIGFYNENGLLFVTDRLKELIKVKGFQVAPAELESILRNHPDVVDAAVIGIPDEIRGEIPKAFIVRRPKSRVSSNDIQNFVANQVSNFKRIRGGVQFVDNIPKTASGKILRREIREKL